MVPTFSDFFNSFYYSNTYVPSVDLSEQGVSSHLLENENPELAATAKKLISHDAVKKVLSDPLTYDLEGEVLERNAVLESHHFRLLSIKPNLQTGQKVPFYSVIEHDELEGWIIKSGATRVPKGQLLIGPMNNQNEMAFFTDEDSLLRIEMANRIERVAKEANIDVAVPKKKLVAYDNSNDVTEPNRKYCVICEKINILSVEDTVQTIKDMGVDLQKEVARKISTIVQKAGLVDASFDNIRLTPEGKLAFIDTEPAGLMVAEKPGVWNKLFGPNGASVEKCARIGLFTLMMQTTKAGRGTAVNLEDGQKTETGLEAFHEQVKSDYEETAVPKLSKWKITVSILSLGLIPLINAIIALVKTELTKRVFEQLQAMDTEYAQRVQAYMIEKVSKAANSNNILQVQQAIRNANQELAKEDFVKDHKEKRTPIAQQLFAYTEGVPYKAALAMPS